MLKKYIVTAKMPGKPYTMREMKQIVQYLTERNAYAELRGRKMWVEFASSQIVDRTWQSLKETFIKRILPDIHNPYYKLTVEQISSFRRGSDVTSQNKLEIETISESNSNKDNKDKDQLSKRKNNEQNKTGEGLKCSKIQERSRSSTDTLVLENCNQNEDTHRDQESPTDDDVSMKSLRDCIIYTEPLTPMLQEILHDFDSADDDEPKLQIVEDNEPQNDLEKHRSNSPDIRQSRSFDKSPKEVSENAEIKKANGNVEFPKPTEPSKIKSLKLKKTQRGTWENKNIVSTINGDSNEIETNNITKENSENLDATKPNSESSEKTTQRSSASTVDTQLPNNQEGLLYREAVDKRKSTEDTLEQSENKEDEKKSRKKKHSQTSTNRKKKQKNAISETEDQVNDDNETLSTKDGNINGEINCEIQEDVLENNDNEPPNSKTGEKSLSKDSKPETRLSTGSDVHEIGPSEINPCLKSVSLYAEQFSLSKYSDSDSNENQSNVKEVTATVHHEADEDIASTSNTNKGTTKGDNNALKDVILLNSNSESDNTSPQPPKPSGSIENKSREKVLANLFGFSNARGRRVRNKSFHDKSKHSRYFQRRRTSSKNKPRIVELESTDEYTTTESDTESSSQKYRSRHRRPDSIPILGNNEMGLFVAGRNRVYPLMMKERKSLYNTAAANGDSDEEELYWKTKYLEQTTKLTEEKLRANDLVKLLEQTKQLLEESKRQSELLILQANQVPSRMNNPEPSPEVRLNNVNTENDNEIIRNNVRSHPDEQKTVKIKFTKDREIVFEAGISQMEPMFLLEKMVQMFSKPNDAKSSGTEDDAKDCKSDDKDSKTDEKERKSNVKESKTDVKQSKSDVKGSEGDVKGSKTDGNESKTGDKESKTDNKDSKPDVVRISSDRSTRQSTPSIAIDPEVHEKVSKIEGEIFKKIEEMDNLDENKAELGNVTKRRPRQKKVPFTSTSSTSLESVANEQKTSKRSENEMSNIERPVRSKRAKVSDVHSDIAIISGRRNNRVPKTYSSDAEIARVTRRTKSTGKMAPVSIPENDPSIRYKFPKIHSEHFSSYSKKEPKIFLSPGASRFSESTQGYEDSDISPPKQIVKKRGLSVRSSRKNIRRRSHPYLADIDSSESNVSKITNVQKTPPNSSPNSEEYKSESYRLLMPITRPFMKLGKIDKINMENYPNSQATLNLVAPLNIDVDNKVDSPSCDSIITIIRAESFGGNSSNVSCSLSPELSVVENLSLVKQLISDSIEHNPTLNETHASVSADANNYNKFFISEVDISVPLMAQNCELHQSQVEIYENATVADSLKIMPSEEPPSSDSLDQKLQNLLLESAKKPKGQIEDNLMDVDPVVTEVQTKRSKILCSTPKKNYKRKSFKTKPPNAKTLEQHTTSCSYEGKTMCPPIINIVGPNGENDNNNFNVDDKTAAIIKTRGKKKKDVIKVKIQRPKRTRSSGTISVFTDNGINDSESGVFLQDSNASVDLIHNHSDNCLQTNECLGNSIEFIENMSKSVVEVHDSIFVDKEMQLETDGISGVFFAPVKFKRDAQDNATVTESVKIIPSEEPSSSNSLGQRLQNLLLESAKNSKGQIEDNFTDIDPVATELQTKGCKNRCVTLKKTSKMKSSRSKLPNAQTLEEHTTSCAYKGKTMSPPIINIVGANGDIDNNHFNVNDEIYVANRTRAKKNKDIIKVKIQRPKRARSSGTISACTDNGINDSKSGVFLQDISCCNSSVDLIHNHSDTCLQTNECLGDSIEFMENMSKSVVEVHDSIFVDKEMELETNGISGEFLTQEKFKRDGQAASSLRSAVRPLHESFSHSGTTVFHTPRSINESFNSLITQDLSEDSSVCSKPTNWYLLSEDDTNASFPEAQSYNSNTGGVGANLNQIFPLTCAIPNLSTISENIERNDSRRFVLNSDSDTNSNSPRNMN